MKPALTHILDQLGESSTQGDVNKSRLRKRLRDIEEKINRVDPPPRKRKKTNIVFLLLSLIVSVNWTLLAPLRWTFTLVSSPLKRSITTGPSTSTAAGTPATAAAAAATAGSPKLSRKVAFAGEKEPRGVAAGWPSSEDLDDEVLYTLAKEKGRMTSES